MKINLDYLTIVPTVNPTREWNLNGFDWEDYRITGFLCDLEVGHITISRAEKYDEKYDRFFFDGSTDPPTPKPFVAYQGTEEEFRGNGICGKLIIFANEFYRGKLGTTLYSDTHFVQSFRVQSKRVWQKLQEQELAVFKPYVLDSGGKQDRWFMI